MNEISDYLKILNETGFFLQMRVAKEARQVFSAVSEEVAFEYGGRPAKLDVLAEKLLFGSVRGFFFIESKRHLHDYSSWIFLTPEVKRPIPPYLLGFGLFDPSVVLDEFYELAQTIGDTDKRPRPRLTILNRGFPDINMEVDYIGIEVKRSESNKHQMEDLTGACKDVITATHGMAMEVMKRSYEDKMTREETSLFIPVVVTTANLFIAKADINKIALSDGKLADQGLELKSVPWLIYEYSLTADLLLPVNMGSQRWSSKREDLLRRRHILIANSDELPKFLKGLANS
jgi:hypothetical protein